VIGDEKYTPSRVKELSGGFNIFQDSVTGQYLRTKTLRTLRESRLQSFAQAVNSRRFRGWALPFQVSPDELAALFSIPSIHQPNIEVADP
jgi:hypothetical protein